MAAAAETSARGKRKAQTKERRRQAKQQKRDADRATKADLPFRMPLTPRVHVVESKFGPKERVRLPVAARAALEDRLLELIPHNGSTSHAAIVNPNYEPKCDIPRFAAIRFARCVDEDAAARLLNGVNNLEVAKLPFQKTKAHGASFRQAWLGIWKKYQAVPFVTSTERTSKAGAGAAIKQLRKDLDQALTPAARYLRQFDETIYNRTRVSHQGIVRLAIDKVLGRRVGGAGAKEWFEEDTDRVRTSSYRLGGLGSMLAVSISTGAGTKFHYDDGDDGSMYSMILVLETGGNLLLPETGYKLQVKPGDVVFFLAQQQLHKLDVKRADSASEPRQVVFTVWTDKQSMRATEPTRQDFYPKKPGDGTVDNDIEEGDLLGGLYEEDIAGGSAEDITCS